MESLTDSTSSRLAGKSNVNKMATVALHGSQPCRLIIPSLIRTRLVGKGVECVPSAVDRSFLNGVGQVIRLDHGGTGQGVSTPAD